MLFLPSVVNAADQRAILELRVNEVKKGEVAVVLRDGDVLVKLKDLQAAGLRAHAGQQESLQDEPYVLLSSLAPQVSFKIDEKDLSLNLTAQPSILGFNRYDAQSNRPAGIVYNEDSSGFFNYSVGLRDLKYANAFTEAGISVKNGLLYSAVSRNENGSFVRGLSNLTISNRENLNRTVVGDRLVASDVLGGSLVMGGVSFFREFSLDPYFVRNPGLNYSGAVATPSTVDVYVNGQLLRRVPVPLIRDWFYEMHLDASRRSARNTILRLDCSRKGCTNSVTISASDETIWQPIVGTTALWYFWRVIAWVSPIHSRQHSA